MVGQMIGRTNDGRTNDGRTNDGRTNDSAPCISTKHCILNKKYEFMYVIVEP